MPYVCSQDDSAIELKSILVFLMNLFFAFGSNFSFRLKRDILINSRPALTHGKSQSRQSEYTLISLIYLNTVINHVTVLMASQACLIPPSSLSSPSPANISPNNDFRHLKT